MYIRELPRNDDTEGDDFFIHVAKHSSAFMVIDSGNPVSHQRRHSHYSSSGSGEIQHFDRLNRYSTFKPDQGSPWPLSGVI